MAPCKEKGKSSRNVPKDVGCSQSAVSKIWTKYKRYGKVVKGKHTGRPRKTSKCQDRKQLAICLENRKCTAKQMRNKWAETGVNGMGFTYRKAKRKPSLTSKQKRTRLHWAKEKAKTVKTFLEERYIGSMSCLANCLDLNPFENLWG
uniref:Transposase Tc1-like domain-containing protein n=1 Tax=Gouania willdenowi TaxID=441366 RepID=A0A8C5E1B0_GOUWI